MKTKCRHPRSSWRLAALTADAAGELDVLGHDGSPLGVDGAQVGVLEQTNKVSLGGLLQRQDGGSLESEIGLEVLGDLTDKALEGQLADKELSGLLVSADLTESHGTGSVSVGLLHTSGGGGGLTGSLGGELLTGGLASSRLAGGLFGTSHFEKFEEMSFESSKFVRRSSQRSHFFVARERCAASAEDFAHLIFF